MANKLQQLMKKYKALAVSSEEKETMKAAMALEKLHTPPVQPPAFLTEQANPDTISSNPLNNLFEPLPGDEQRWELEPGDIDPITGQPGDLYGAPDVPSQWWLEQQEIREYEQNMKDQGIKQDPMLEGTGQPGELYMTPGSPEWEQKYGPYERPKDFDDTSWMKNEGLIKDNNGLWKLDPEYEYTQKVNDEESTKNMSPLDLIRRDSKIAASWDVAGITRDPSQPRFSMFYILDDIGLVVDTEVS